MEKIFYTEASVFPSSTAAITHILRVYFNLEKTVIDKTENGKPFLLNPKARLSFSVSHTREKLFIALSDENVGVDAEMESRCVNYPLLVKKFPVEERAEISDATDFLRRWTVKESAIKWLGGTIARDLKKISFRQNELRYDGIEIPVYITTRTVEDHILSVCSERDFSTAEVIKL